MTRLEANREILKILSQQIEEQPHVRFSQLLQNLQVVKSETDYSSGKGELIDGSMGTMPYSCYLVDEFYLESEALLSRIKEYLNVQKEKEL